jgi:histidinol dehydrogenase
MKIIHQKAPGFSRAWKSFLTDQASADTVEAAVRDVLVAVRKEGNKAVLAYTKKWDGADLTPRQLKVDPTEMKAAWKALPAGPKTVIKEAASAIREFHEKTLPRSWRGSNPHGATVGERFYPLERVGLYIPGGNVPLVSTVLMTAIPARVAGVDAIAVATPPNAAGEIAPALLAALYHVGITEVYRMGGAQAVAALGYGTSTIPAVEKIAGPGNAYVMEAKRQIFGTIGVDLLPGPSEVMVIADAGAKPEWVAADLIAQAEHGSGKEKVCAVLPSKEFAQAVVAAAKLQVPSRRHSAAVAKVLKSRTLLAVVDDLDGAVVLANEMAPEHLELQVADSEIETLTRRIRKAGAILQGYHTPTVLGDFVAGPSHTLPTNTAARFSGGLQVIDFMRRSSIVRYRENQARRALPAVRVFSLLEDLDGHGYSLECRHSDDSSS